MVTTPSKFTEILYHPEEVLPLAYAMFDYDAASGTFAPATKASKPPVGNDAKCGAACHENAASMDYIFTAYPKR